MTTHLTEQQLDLLADQLVEQEHQLITALVAHRKHMGLTQQDVATRMGTTTRNVERIENGHTDLLQSTLQRYALATGALITHQVHPTTPTTPATQALHH